MSLNSLTELTNSFSTFDKILEFEKRYVQSYLYLVFPNSPFDSGFYYLKQIIDKESNKPRLEFYNHNWDGIIVTPDSDVEIQVVWPEVGLFNFENTVFFFRRFPQRQWKRGICTENTHITKLLIHYPYNNIGISPQILESTLLSTVCNNIESAIMLLNTTNVFGTAINKTIAIFQPPFAKTPYEYLLVYNTTPCALVNNETKTITTKHPFLHQEIIDYSNSPLERESKWKIQ